MKVRGLCEYNISQVTICLPQLILGMQTQYIRKVNPDLPGKTTGSPRG
jgi:hypothetical protein